MKKIILAFVLVAATALLGGCGACCGNYNNSCCGADSYTGTWY